MASDSFWVWKVRPLFLEPIGGSICGLTEVCRKMTRGPGSLRVILKKKWNPFCTFCLFQVSLGRIIRMCAVNCFAVADPCLSCWQDGNSRNIQLEASQTNHTSSDIYTLLLVSYCGFAQIPKGHLLQFTAEEVASAVGSSVSYQLWLSIIACLFMASVSHFNSKLPREKGIWTFITTT